MKRQIHSSSPPSSPLSNSEISDEIEPVPKRPRIFVSSPTPPPDNEIDADDEDDEEIIIDELIFPSMTINENSQNENISDEDDDDDIIEIEHQTLNLSTQDTDNVIIVVSDSESDDNSDDQGIDVTDDALPSVSSIINGSISSSDIEDIEIVQEEIEEVPGLMDDDDDDEGEDNNDDDDHEPLEIMNNNDDDDHETLEIMNNDDDDDDDDDHESLEIVNNNYNNDELIDLTDDEPIFISCSPILPERKLSTDVQQCPICLETLSHLQRTGIYLIITRCRHVMCTLCSRQLLATSSRCPLCRENVSSTTLMPYCILT